MLISTLTVQSHQPLLAEGRAEGQGGGAVSRGAGGTVPWWMALNLMKWRGEVKI